MTAPAPKEALMHGELIAKLREIETDWRNLSHAEIKLRVAEAIAALSGQGQAPVPAGNIEKAVEAGASELALKAGRKHVFDGDLMLAEDVIRAALPHLTPVQGEAGDG